MAVAMEFGISVSGQHRPFHSIFSFFFPLLFFSTSVLAAQDCLRGSHSFISFYTGPIQNYEATEGQWVAGHFFVFPFYFFSPSPICAEDNAQGRSEAPELYAQHKDSVGIMKADGTESLGSGLANSLACVFYGLVTSVLSPLRHATAAHGFSASLPLPRLISYLPRPSIS